jgi:hypothetical protein
MNKKTSKQKLNEDQIASLENLKKENQELSFKLGQLYRQKILIEKSIEKIENEDLKDFQEKEKDLFKSLEEFYGNGNLDLNTYEFVKA